MDPHAPLLSPSTPALPVPRPQVALWTILRVYFQVGLTGFGMATLHKLQAVVREQRWLSDDEIQEGLALVQLYPGPLMVDFTAYVGYRLRGIPGALLATIGFVLPSFVLMVALSALYFAADSLPWVHPLFLGLEALVVGVLFHVTLDLGGRTLQRRTQAVIALVAFAALLFKVSAVIIVLAALGLGAWRLRPNAGAGKPPGVRMPPGIGAPIPLQRWAGMSLVIATVLVVAVAAWSRGSTVGDLTVALFKIGAVAFGNGATIIPLIQAEVVDVHHWLTLEQFADGIALGQITPGPFLITAAFVGYKLGGVSGAALATFAIFAPSFAMTLVFSEIFPHVRNLQGVRGALAGVMASFVGLLAVAVLQIGSVALNGPAALALAGTAFIAVRFFKLDTLWVFGGGVVLWSSLLLCGLA